MKSEKLNAEELRQINLLQERENQELLKKFILDKTEAKVKDKFSDEGLDRELEKRKLLDTVQDLWKIKNIEGIVLKKPKDYEAIFSQEYYQEIYRLNDWEFQGKISKKPRIVGKYTNEIIYYRFAAEVLPFLRIVNPYIIPGMRRYKHHQWLTPGARIELEKFISESIDLMKQCKHWNEFRIAYCKRFNVPYQLKLPFPNS